MNVFDNALVLLGTATTNSHDIVLDYFAGSDTTGNSVISPNCQDDGYRKYILVEMGHHFDSVMLPRIKKTVYSLEWKNGKPKLRDNGVSQFIKYLRIESYEDTLTGLVLSPKNSNLLEQSAPALVEDYQLRYALDEETADSVVVSLPTPSCLCVVHRTGRRAP